MASGPEAKVKDGVKKLLREYGAWYYMPVQNGMGVTGIPDFIACLNGEFFGIECKAPGKLANVTANQTKNILAINAAGGTAFAVDNVPQLETILVVLGHKRVAP